MTRSKRVGTLVVALLVFSIWIASSLIRPLCFEREFRNQMRERLEAESDTLEGTHTDLERMLPLVSPDYATEVMWCLQNPLTKTHVMDLYFDGLPYAVAEAARDESGRWTISKKSQTD